MRIVVCGSRDYDDEGTLRHVMDGVLSDAREHWGEDPTICHGDCPYGGADALADRWARDRGLDVEAYPAASHARSAFLARDREMVDAGAELVVGFSSRTHATAGTGYTCRYAYERGVPVIFTGADRVTRRFRDEAWTTRQTALDLA